VPAANLIGQPGRQGKRIVTGAFSWTAALIGAACVGTMRAAFEYALDLARSETRLGTVPVIEHQNVMTPPTRRAASFPHKLLDVR
jgi:nitroalkane oxidase